MKKSCLEKGQGTASIQAYGEKETCYIYQGLKSLQLQP